MKLLINLVVSFSLCSAGAKSTDSAKSRKVKMDQAFSWMTENERKSTLTFFALHESASKLQVYLNKRDMASMKPLLAGWSVEDQTLLKHDLAKLPKNLSVAVKDQSLIIKHNKESVEMSVVDAIQGKFKLNEKIIHIQNYRKYEAIKQEIEKALAKGEQARFHLLELLLPKAHAVLFLPILGPVLTAGGAFLARHVATRWILTEGGKAIYLTGIGTYVGANIGKQVNKPEEAKKTGENEVQIKDADEEPVPVPNPENSKFICKKTEDGFEKQAGFIYYRPKDAEALKNQPIDKTKVVNYHDFKYNYQRHPEDPTKLVLKSISEVVKTADGVVLGERVYKLVDEGGFHLEELNSELLKKKKDAFYRNVNVAEKKDCTGKHLAEDDVCKALNVANLALARTQQTCNMENPDEAIRQNKVENKIEEKKQGSRK